ncbi:MAG TPA: lysylphosphatidylglycerol synthase domain-containing protein [Candidatus Saccharimonadales bacterium]|nr:lysylphosphatidylglycerol synthase domain-containing protein [Candidatus Saccharimonadales bacterium]
MKYLKLYKTLFSWAIVAVVIFFFAKTLQNNWNNLGEVSLKPDLLIVIAVILYVLSIVSSGILWGKIVDKLTKAQIPIREAIRVHLASWLLKYIPGQAGSLINKIAWGRQRKLDGKKITASFVYENVFLLLASTVPTIPILFIALGNKFSEGGTLFLPLLASIPFVAIVLSPWFFTKAINFFFKLAKKQKLSQQEMLNSKDNIKYFLLFIIPRIINGAAFVFVAESLINISASQYIVFGSLYVLAGIVGVLAIFVPSGLGVREAVIVLFASAYIPVEQAVILAIVSRFYATIADILAAVVYLLLKRTEGNTT